MTEKKLKILVDADPTMLTGGLDIDDDLAIAVLANSPEVELLGLTTTYGNASLEKTYKDAQELVLFLNIDTPVLPGADWGTRDFKRETEASRFIAETAAAHSGELHIITLGPLTNMAAALYNSPDLAQSTRSLTMMGGRLKNAFCMPWKELNLTAHPDAANLVLDSDINKTIIATELCTRVVVKKSLVQSWAANDKFIFAEHIEKIEGFRKFNQKIDYLFHPTAPKGGFHPWDVICVAYLLAPDLFYESVKARMHFKGRKISFMVNAENPNVNAPFKINADAFLDFMTHRLTRYPSS